MYRDGAYAGQITRHSVRFGAVRLVYNLLMLPIVNMGFNMNRTRGNRVHDDLMDSASKKFGCALAFGWRQVEQMFRNDSRLSWWLSNISSNASE